MKYAPLLSFCLLLALGGLATAQTIGAPADMISNFRLEHGEGRVILDPTLNRIAHDQAAAMAAKDVLDHDVLGPFGSRVAVAGSGRAAENIAYGYDNFPKTLDQWIGSSGHRKNLLLHDASRVGIASVKSATTGRTYWAMEIAGDYRPKVERLKADHSKTDHSKTAGAKSAPKVHAQRACRLKLLGLCLSS